VALNVIVWLAPARNTTLPVPADHEALVDEFVHAPAKFQVAPPRLKNPLAAMLMLPPIVFVPDAPAVIPPVMFAVRVPTVSDWTPVARLAPAFTVSVLDTSSKPA